MDSVEFFFWIQILFDDINPDFLIRLHNHTYTQTHFQSLFDSWSNLSRKLLLEAVSSPTVLATFVSKVIESKKEVMIFICKKVQYG